MGLSVAIAGGIVMVTIMLVMLSIPTVVNTIFSINEVSSQSSKIEDSVSKTEISIEEIYTTIGSPRINFTLINEGSTTLWDFNNFNVLIEYTGAISGKKTEQLSFQQANNGECLGLAPPIGQWCIESISNDVADPKLLNFGEIANIRTSLNENLVSLTAIVAVATDNGVTFKTSGTSIDTSIPRPNSVNPKKWGQVIPVTTGPAQLLGLISASLAVPGAETLVYDNNDQGVSVLSGGAGANAGVDQVAALFNIYRLDQDAKLIVKFRQTEITTNRMFLGFRSGGTTLPNANDGLLHLPGVQNGVGLCINSTSTTYQFCHSEGVGNTVWDNTGVTEDTLPHTVEVYAESANNQWCLKLDSGSPLCATTNIPVAGTLMWMNAEAESVDASTTTFIYYNIYTEINPP